jgi:hypothetical protein
MDGNFLCDTRSPWMISDAAAVTLASTDKALLPVGNLPPLGANYFWAGKLIEMEMFGRITTGTTPGNGTFSLYWGNGADANGTIVQSSAAFALTASQTNLSWKAKLFARCRSIGASGQLLVWGNMDFNNGVVATSIAPILIPASAPAAVTVDLTLANLLVPQFKRSGSTAETMQVHDFVYKALN